VGVVAFRSAGIACVVLAVAMFVVGLLIYVGGNEVAAMLMIFSLGGFVLGIGLLAAARRIS
jgi:hypothetical protein